MDIDRQQIKRWYSHFKDGSDVEIRIIFNDGKDPRTWHQRFNNADKISDYLANLPARPHQCYWTLNELGPEIIVNGRVKAVEDADIIKRKWILIDLDPNRQTHTNATDVEKALAYKLLDDVKTYLDGFLFPDPVITDSGNGYHLYYKVDAECTDENTNIVEAFLQGLSNKFSNDAVKVDTINSNNSRISKIPGTWAVKGPSTDERPQRMAKIVEMPEKSEIVEMADLRAVAENCGVSIFAKKSEGSKNIDPEQIDFDVEIRVRQYVDAVDEFVKNGGHVKFMESDWLSLGYAFASIGPLGNECFHRVMSHHPDYNHNFAEKEFDRLRPRALAKDSQGREISIGTFFHWCQVNGICPDQDDEAFPFDVFPAQVQEMINHAYHCRLKFPKIYTSCGILCAVSCAIGNLYQVEFTKEHCENAVLYMAMVGGKGKNKSHPLSFALRPLHELDDKLYHEYLADYARYKEDQDRPKKERFGIAKPIRQRHIAGDITAEALASAMSENPRGLLVYNDELIGWIKAQNQYRSGNGSDAEMWLSLWSGKNHDVTRKTSGSVRISRPFVSVCGTIQPSVIPTLAENREANGFLDRILFAWPQNIKVEALSEDDDEMSQEDIDRWSEAILSIVNIPLPESPFKIRLSREAERQYILWQRAEAEKCNQLDRQRIRKTDDVAYNGIHAKMESYCLRFALILETLSYEYEKKDKNCSLIISEISSKSMAGALRLCRYFTAQAMSVRAMLNASEIDLLAEDKKRLYIELPDSFSTAEGLAVADRLHVPERTYKRFLNSKTYFKHEARGQYSKAIIL